MFNPDSLVRAVLIAWAVSAVPAIGQCYPGCSLNWTGPTLTGSFSGTSGPLGSSVPFVICLTGTFPGNTVNVIGLTLGPNTIVQVPPGVSLQVVGPMSAVGTPTEPVVFTSSVPSPTASQRWGGLIFIGPSVPGTKVMRFCRVDNAAYSGMRIRDDSPTIDDCLVIGNLATAQNGTSLSGGGVDVANHSMGLTMNHVEVRGNQALANHGGGIHAVMTGGTTLILNQCWIVDNSVNLANAPVGQLLGGGLRISGNSVLDNCRIEGNRLYSNAGCFGCLTIGQGGGIYYDGTSATTHVLRRSILSGNLCHHANCAPYALEAAYGGGCIVANCTLNAVSSTIVCNTAVTACAGPGGFGGGVYVAGAAASANLTNCTIASNSPTGVDASGTAVAIDSCIVWGNNGGGAQLGASVPCPTFSDIQGGTPCGNNMNLNPIFAGAATFGSGCTPAAFALSSYSPLVNAGNPALSNASPLVGFGPGNTVGALGGPLNGGVLSPCHIHLGANAIGVAAGSGNSLSLAFGTGGSAAGGSLSVTNAQPGSTGVLVASLSYAWTTVGCWTGYPMPPPAATLPISLPAGTWSLPISLLVPALSGTPVYVQVAAVGPSGFAVSNALELAF